MLATWLIRHEPCFDAAGRRKEAMTIAASCHFNGYQHMGIKSRTH
jgi:hypothetical protein